MPTDIRTLVDQLEELNSCQEALSCLMCPDDHDINRDKTSVLMSYLVRQQNRLTEALQRQLHITNLG